MTPGGGGSEAGHSPHPAAGTQPGHTRHHPAESPQESASFKTKFLVKETF